MSQRKSSFGKVKKGAKVRGSVFSSAVVMEGYLKKHSTGLIKRWQRRYFAVKGHYLSYYASFKDCPLFSSNRQERNMVDLARVTFLRAKTLNKSLKAPEHAFDIATIDREWTVVASTAADRKREREQKKSSQRPSPATQMHENAGEKVSKSVFYTL